jgi:2-polyprenyl-3-methyl-5-hydroxy-6-metoxy-1,4-benzoquinol methylase
MTMKPGGFPIKADACSLTRGHGLLEPFLARLRSQKANQLVPDHLRQGRILDIGCGSYPYFLSHTYFREKYAIDQNEMPEPIRDIAWHLLDLNSVSALPFQENYFSVITMLAVIEHLDPVALVGLFSDIYHKLIPGGLLIITTPSAWSDNLLCGMAKIGLVSAEEIKEHVYAYTLPLLGWYFGKAGFSMEKIRFGYFEFGLNMWAVAEKDGAIGS